MYVEFHFGVPVPFKTRMLFLFDIGQFVFRAQLQKDKEESNINDIARTRRSDSTIWRGTIWNMDEPE